MSYRKQNRLNGKDHGKHDHMAAVAAASGEVQAVSFHGRRVQNNMKLPEYKLATMKSVNNKPGTISSSNTLCSNAARHL